MIGSKLGPYEITAKLGEGGMGEVYRATDSKLRREVAIKVLPRAFTEDKDRLAIKDEVQKAQGKFFDLQWQTKEETDKMVKLLQQSPADEAKILAQADRVMALERDIKRTHLTLLVRLRNMLTPEQQAQLQRLR